MKGMLLQRAEQWIAKEGGIEIYSSWYKGLEKGLVLIKEHPVDVTLQDAPVARGNYEVRHARSLLDSHYNI